MKPVVSVRASAYPPIQAEAVPAGVAMAVVLGTSALLGVAPSVPLVVVAGCAVAAVYHLDRRLSFSDEDRRNRPARRAWYVRHATGSNARLLALGVVVAWAAARLRPETWAACGLCLVLAVCYLWPLLPGGRRLKAFGAGKPFALAAAWAGAGVALPVIEAGAGVEMAAAGALGVYRFFFLLPNFWLSDWPDRHGDAAAGIRTPATRLDDRSMRRLAVLWSGVAWATAAAGWSVGLFPGWIFVDALGALAPGYLIRTRLPEAHRPYIALDILTAWPLATYALVVSA